MIKTEIEIPDLENVKDVALSRARREALAEIMKRHKRALRSRTRSKSVWSQIKEYKPRTQEYNKRKGLVRSGTKGQGHRFFGDTEKRIRAAPVVSKPKQSLITVTGLNRGYAKRVRGNRPNMHRELQALTPQEQKQYAELFEKLVIDYINNNPKARKKKRLKS